MKKEEIKEALKHLQVDNNYSWELYLFNIDNRLTGSPYKISKINFKCTEDILKYGQNLANCMEKYQLDKTSEVETYCGNNGKISCDKLNLDNEIIQEYWNYFKTSLDNSVVDSSENIKVKGYIIYAKPKIADLKKFIFVKKANPIVQGNKKKSKTFKMDEDNTLDNFNDRIFKFYLNIDFFIIDNILYTFNLSFEDIFKIEKTLNTLKIKAIKKIKEKKYFSNQNNFFIENLNKKIISKMYIEFDEEILNKLDDIDTRKNVAKSLNLKLDDSGIFEFNDLDDIKNLIKHLNHKIIVEKETQKILAVSGKVTEILQK